MNTGVDPKVDVHQSRGKVGEEVCTGGFFLLIRLLILLFLLISPALHPPLAEYLAPDLTPPGPALSLPSTRRHQPPTFPPTLYFIRLRNSRIILEDKDVF